MDVHPPHHSLNTWRDFFIHIATITIGLLIALALEAAVEALHHRHIVREARENIRQEIEQNETLARENETSVQANAENMKTNMQKARDLRANSHALDHNEMHFNFSWSGFKQSAWLSARDSGALTYMPTAEVQKYADNYVQQEIVSREAVAIFTQQSQIAAPLFMEKGPSDMRPEDIQKLMRDSAETYLRLITLKQIIQQLDKSYAATLRE